MGCAGTMPGVPGYGLFGRQGGSPMASISVIRWLKRARARSRRRALSSRGRQRAVPRFVSHWRIPIASALLAAIAVIVGIRSANRLGAGADLALNVLAEAMGLFAGVAVGYVLVQRHVDSQARRVTASKNAALGRLRNQACNSVSQITGRLYDFPPDYYGGGGGPWWLQQNFAELWKLLDGNDPRQISSLDPAKGSPSAGGKIDPQPWRWIIKGLGDLVEEIDYVQRIYGPTLLEHGRLLAHLRIVRAAITGELGQWDTFDAVYERAFSAWSRQPFSERASKGPTPQLLPREALGNLHNIGRVLIRLVASTTAVVRDWKEGPEVRDPPPVPYVSFGWAGSYRPIIEG